MIDSGKIKKIAEEINIDICGITNSDQFLDYKDWLEERIEKDYISEFEERDINYRIDPLLTMEDCKSIIVIGLSYNVENTHEKAYRLKGSISKSSWGIDYHRVVEDKMKLLIDEIGKIKKFEYKLYVDTGPLIDRELANRAGIGYFGKNCSIINPKYGSFISIGYILTDLSLKVDNNIDEECGDCELCIRACPTGALESAYRLNPKKCISYLTQTRDIIPEKLRHRMGIKIYGCDSCQLVCPKNKNVVLSVHEEFIPRVTGGYFDLEELMEISNREFKDKYGHMAGSWRGKNILKRNAIIGLANMKQLENINILEKELSNESEMIRYYAAWAIKKIEKYN